MATSREPLAESELRKFNQDLQAACTANDVAAVRTILEQQPLTRLDAKQALYNACDRLPLMRCLLEHGANPNDLGIKTYVGDTSEGITEAFDNLKLIAEFGYDIQANGHLVLQDFAASRDAVDWLLDRGVDINQTDITRTDQGFGLARGDKDFSNHLLNRAAAAGNIEFFDYLMSRGANPRNSFALHCTTECQDPELCVSMIRHLLDQYQLEIEAEKEELREFFAFFPDSGTALNNAVYHKNLPAIQELLKRGANPATERTCCLGDDCFYPGFLPALPVLLDAGADADHALYRAVFRNNLEAVRVILQYDVDVASVLREDRERIDAIAARPDIDPEEISFRFENSPMSVEMMDLLEGALQAKRRTSATLQETV